VNVITAGGNSVSSPYSNSFDYKLQFLYCAAELGAKGNITKIAYRLLNNSAASDYSSFNVVLGYTTGINLGMVSFLANTTGAQTVYTGTVSIPDGYKAGDWIEISLSTPFAYDGINSLVVQTSNFKGSGMNFIRATSDSGRYSDRRAYSTNISDAVPGGKDNHLADLKLEIK
jgi:hypothetical protein